MSGHQWNESGVDMFGMFCTTFSQEANEIMRGRLFTISDRQRNTWQEISYASFYTNHMIYTLQLSSESFEFKLIV